MHALNVHPHSYAMSIHEVAHPCNVHPQSYAMSRHAFVPTYAMSIHEVAHDINHNRKQMAAFELQHFGTSAAKRAGPVQTSPDVMLASSIPRPGVGTHSSS